MKALILIGGKGTRLRPFTCDVPKPLLSVVHRPLLEFQLQVLRRHGIREVILCASYRAEAFRRALGDGRRHGMRLRFVRESSPLGTGGAVRNAAKHLDQTALILNGDLLNALDVTAFLKEHKRTRSEASIALTRVKDPTRYGLVETNASGRIRRFLEKPSWDEITCNTINAGAYLFEPSVVELIPPGVPYSLERGLFPQLLEKRRRLHGYVVKGYWIDIGTVDKYLQVHLDFLGGATPFRTDGLSLRRGFLAGRGARIDPEASREGAGRVAVGAKSRVGPFARFVGSVCVGERCTIGQGAVLENCVVLDDTRVGEGARLERCVVGRRCRLEAHVAVGPGRALGDRSVATRFSQL